MIMVVADLTKMMGELYLGVEYFSSSARLLYLLPHLSRRMKNGNRPECHPLAPPGGDSIGDRSDVQTKLGSLLLCLVERWARLSFSAPPVDLFSVFLVHSAAQNHTRQ